MGRKLQIKRGVKAALPPLDVAELALTTDEKTLYYGTGAENIPVARAAHSHTAADVGAAPKGHVGDASHVTAGEKQGWNGKAAGNHTHTAAQVGAAPASHRHSVSEVTGALRAFAPVNITLPVGSWTAGAPYTQTVSVAGVLASWDHRLGLSPQRIADRTAEKANDKAMGCITYCDTINGGITVTCRDKKPETNILVVLAGEV